MEEIKFRLRIGNEIIGYERWYKGDGSNAHWEHLKVGETVWHPAFLYATDKDLYANFPDKSGQEIYEGDILGYKDSFGRHSAPVCFGCLDVGVGWYLQGPSLKKWLDPDSVNAMEMKVIGKIYEDSHLSRLMRIEKEGKNEKISDNLC